MQTIESAGLLSLLLIGVVATALPAEDVMKKTGTFRIEDRTEEPLMVSDRPHEDFKIGYVNVLRVGNVWHMWYECHDHNYKIDFDGYLCYARSEDGVTWEKPNLGLVEYGGNRENNIVLAGLPISGVHGHTVLMDPEAKAAERFKIVFTKRVGNEWHVYGGVSPDGIKWELLEKPLLARNSDTQTVCFRDGGIYRLYVRMWSQGLYNGQRQVGYAESKEFGDFPAPTVILSHDEKDPAEFNFYNSAASKLNDSLYIMFPSIYNTKTGTVIPHMAVSADGHTWERIGRGPKLPSGRVFDNKTIYVGPGAIPGDKPNTWWIYYAGSAAGHDDKYQSKIQHMGGIGRFLLVLEN